MSKKRVWVKLTFYFLEEGRGRKFVSPSTSIINRNSNSMLLYEASGNYDTYT